MKKRLINPNVTLVNRRNAMDNTLWKQDFFSEVEPIRIIDPLAIVLGAQDEGEAMLIHYRDAVLLAGHSCPAVSSAYQLTKKALKALYGDETPIRGEVRIVVKGGPRDLAYGPQAQVISFITGSWGETGFKGLGGKFSRNDKLFFDTGDVQFNTFIFQRIDNNRAVSISANPGVLPQDPMMSRLMPMVLQGKASKEDRELFASLWQGNVRKILLESDSYPGLFTLKELKDFSFPDA